MPDGKHLDRILGLDNRPDNSNAFSWDEIKNIATGQRILLRMAPPKVVDGLIVDQGAKVTAVIVLPDPTSDRVTAANMRFPLGQIEGSASMRSQDARIAISAALQSSQYTPPAPLGRPDGTDAFYAQVALLWRYFIEDANPTERLREVNKVSLPTAQRWVSEARKRKFLPPGRRGRAK